MQPVSARIWIVDNNTGSTVRDFVQPSEAATAAAIGDTIYIQGSPTIYNGFSLTKRLTVIGSGYFLSENPNTQANPQSSKCFGLSIGTGADGSVIMGIELGNFSVSSANCSVRRCTQSSGGGGGFGIYGSGTLVEQCYLYALARIVVGGGVSNIIIRNNFIEALATFECFDINTLATNVLIQNNVILGKITLQNAVFTNNIIRDCQAFATSATTVNNNLCNAAQLPAGSGNVNNVDMATVFVGTGSTDAKWQLKSGSPAIAAGAAGLDCGMFGGATAYVLSGMPPIPAIYFFNAPGVGTNASGLPVQLKVKSRN